MRGEGWGGGGKLTAFHREISRRWAFDRLGSVLREVDRASDEAGAGRITKADDGA